MSIFAVIRDGTEANNSALGTRIAKRFPGAFYSVNKGQWLISANMEIRDLAQELDVRKEGRYSGTLIVEVANYYGLHNKKLWAWLREQKATSDE